MSIPDVKQAVSVHQAILVHLTFHPLDTTLASILPHGVVTLVGQHRLFVGIHRYPQLVVVKSAHPLLDAEALRVCRTLPKFTPGKRDGKPIEATFTVPVIFKLRQPKLEDFH